MDPVSTIAASVTVATAAGDAGVQVTDSAGAPLPGVVVHFRVTQGGGKVSPGTDTTDSQGVASATFTASSVAGANEVSASAQGIAPVRFAVTGVAGPTQSLTLSQRSIRFSASQDSLAVTVAPRDAFGNATGDSVAWIARDSTLVRVTGISTRPTTGAAVQVLRRPGQTWIVGTSGSATDSLMVAVHDASSSPCDFIATPTMLPVGGSLVVENSLACVSSTTPGAEYGIVVHQNTAVAALATFVEITATGIVAPATAFPMVIHDSTPGSRDSGFEQGLRAREAREAPSRVAGARAWFRDRAGNPETALFSLPASVKVGDLVDLNVNAFDFCSNPKLRPARVVALTQTAVVLADTTNPADGFTADEYRAFGVTLDTLVHPVVTGAFGAPTDIDGNGRVGILFTRAVNELSTSSGGGVVLGFYYLRDLLPLRDPLGDCAGSNRAEMFYVLVPDPAGQVNGAPRSKEFVSNLVMGTIAHEYQHLINAARRMYVTGAAHVDEEVWLNEGLSHIAEELVFYEASGLQPRSNIGATQLALGTPGRAAFELYQRANFTRYREYLRTPAPYSPLSQGDGFEVRGASWSFLRYLADRAGTSDGDLWKRIVNASTTGVSNLEGALGGTGLTVLGALRDWSVSVLADDSPAASSAAFRQPSWDFVTGIPLVLPSFGLAPRVLNDGVPAQTTLGGGGSTYMRFGVAEGRQALVSTRGGGPALRITIVRMK